MNDRSTIKTGPLEIQAKQDSENSGLICYCFGYSRKDIEDDLAKNGRSLIMERITAEKKAGSCDCAKRNPKGR